MQPSVEVYLTAVREYLQGLLRGNLGKTNNGLQVSRLLLPATRRSLQLLGISLAIALPVGLGWGALLATVRRRLPILLLYGASTLALSLPSFVILLLGMQAITPLMRVTGVRFAYVQGYGLDRHVVLPTLVLVLRGAAFMAWSIKLAHQDILRQDWIRVARAKGLGGLRLWRHHVLPALRLPLLGSALGMLRVMVSSFVIVDYVYGWGGLGGRMLHIDRHGIGTAESQVNAGAAAVLVIFFVITDLLGRLLLGRLDPRLQGRATE
jgi:ABC-type dipeptide/oligopeptide/nickel transport system permease component